MNDQPGLDLEVVEIQDDNVRSGAHVDDVYVRQAECPLCGYFVRLLRQGEHAAWEDHAGRNRSQCGAVGQRLCDLPAAAPPLRPSRPKCPCKTTTEGTSTL